MATHHTNPIFEEQDAPVIPSISPNVTRRLRVCTRRCMLYCCIPFRIVKKLFFALLWTPWFPITYLLLDLFFTLSLTIVWHSSPNYRADFGKDPMQFPRLLFISVGAKAMFTVCLLATSRIFWKLLCCNVNLCCLCCGACTRGLLGDDIDDFDNNVRPPPKPRAQKQE